MTAEPRVLCVDDEQPVLDGLRRNLRGRYRVASTTDPLEALDLLGQDAAAGFAVILSDLRMPRMSGLELLERAQRIAPDTTRILLTGDPDVPGVVAAINECHVFRLMLKPCPANQLEATVAAAAEQHQLVRGILGPLGRQVDGAVALPPTVTADLPELVDSLLTRVPGLEQAVREIATHRRNTAGPAPAAPTRPEASESARILDSILRTGISRSMERTNPHRTCSTQRDEDRNH